MSKGASADQTENGLLCDGCSRDVMDFRLHFRNSITGEILCPDCFEDTDE